MKTLRTLLVITIVILAGISAKAQSSAQKDGTANAKVIQVLSLAADKTLEFGSFATTDQVGTITVPTSGSASKTNLVAVSTNQQAATFNVSGASGYDYHITLPDNGTISLKKSGAADMPVSDFKAKTASKNDETLVGTLGDSGDSFSVGATLTVANTQTPGDYTATFPVTVAYE